jgi:hypothetical protein
MIRHADKKTAQPADRLFDFFQFPDSFRIREFRFARGSFGA